ncbi:MND1-interacting protein 1-like [Iris pallida]|uniref:MND1-interacting protein 1-like n=1 Tax=Iris pallida TaxID=29817 RepID=A0AAX6IM41_IRIPA|nr:MND1-interacting protein 1-like [Iris pallida]
MDAFSNVVHNAVAFLSSGDANSGDGSAFSDLHLQEYSLAGMVCLLQQVRPNLSRSDAMWCLLASDLNVGRAAALEIPSRSDPKPVPSPRLEESDAVDSVLKSLENMSIKEEGEGEEEEEGKEMILDLVKQVRDLETQVKEQKAWAQRKAVQAVKKLSNDLTELKVLRMEREENQMVKMGKQALEDSTMKRLVEMEGALKKASGQVDRANAAPAGDVESGDMGRWRRAS